MEIFDVKLTLLIIFYKTIKLKGELTDLGLYQLNSEAFNLFKHT